MKTIVYTLKEGKEAERKKEVREGKFFNHNLRVLNLYVYSECLFNNYNSSTTKYVNRTVKCIVLSVVLIVELTVAPEVAGNTKFICDPVGQ